MVNVQVRIVLGIVRVGIVLGGGVGRGGIWEPASTCPLVAIER